MTTTTLTSRVGSAPAADALADELLAATSAELPALADLPDRERLLVATWLASLCSVRTRRLLRGSGRPRRDQLLPGSRGGTALG